MTLTRLLGISTIALMYASSAMAKDWKTVTVAMEGSYEPYNFTDPSGKIIGFEVDVLNDVCARMKVECTISPQDWDGIIPGLNAGKFDVVMDGMSITPERQKAVDFSIAYANVPAAFLADKNGSLAHMTNGGKVVDLSKDDAGDKAAIDALRNDLKGKTIGVQASSIQATFADKYLKDVATIREYKTTDEHNLDLETGRIDATFADSTYSMRALAKPDAQNLAMVGPLLKGGAIFGSGAGAAFRKEDKDLREMYDKAMKAALDDGSVKKYSLKWFKTDITP